MAAVPGGGMPVQLPRSRLLAAALAGSLALHAAAFFLLPLSWEVRWRAPEFNGLTAHLVEVKRATTAPPASAAERAPAAVETPAREHRPVLRRQEIVSRQATQALPPTPAAPQASAPALPTAAPAGRAAGPAATSVAAAASPAPQADPLREYRAELVRLAGRYKRYPRLAIENNWEGRAEVRLVIGADGAIASLAVIASAGYAALDEEALEMIRAAQARAAIPAALRGREIVLRIPVTFSLRDAG